MKQKLIRATALTMSMLMLGVTALTGCSNQEEGKTTTSSATEASTAKDTETGTQVSSSETGNKPEVPDNFNEEGLPILKEKETFTIAVIQTSALKAAADKACVLETEEATNVHIEWVEIPKSGWTEKINIMFSTDSMPDAIIGDVDMARNYEQLLALDDYLEAFAPNVTAFFDTRDDYPNALRSPDGTVRALPIGDESTQNIIDSQLWINQKWLDALNLEMPQTPEELKDVLIAFRDKDSNGNGEKDEIPFTFKNAWGWGDAIENLFGAWGVLENGYHVFTQDGKVTFSAKEQGYYDTLSYLNDLYKEGLIDKDVFTLSDDQYAARGASADVIGVFAGYNPANGVGVQNAEDYRVVPVLKQADGKQMVGINNVTKTGGFVINKNCKNPAALVRWYDYINSSLEMSLKWGRGAEGVWWNILEENGKEIPQFLSMDSDILAANGGYKSKAEYRQAESFAGQTPSLWRFEYDEALVYDDKWPKDYKLEAVKEQIQYGVVGLPAGIVSQENEERRSILSTDIDTYLKKFVADSVINGIDDAKWQKHLKTLEDLKVDEYTQLCQELVDFVTN